MAGQVQIHDLCDSRESREVGLEVGKAPSPEEQRIRLLKLIEALCDYIHIRQIRFRTLVQEGDDRGGKRSA